MRFDGEKMPDRNIIKYPETENDLMLELLHLISEFHVLVNSNKQWEEKGKPELREEIKRGIDKIATEISVLYKNPDKNIQWPSGHKDWKQSLDTLRQSVAEARSAAQEDTKMATELDLLTDEKIKLFGDKLNLLRNKQLINVTGLNFYRLTEELEQDFKESLDVGNRNKENSAWNVLNGLLEMEPEKIENIDLLMEKIKKDLNSDFGDIN